MQIYKPVVGIEMTPSIMAYWPIPDCGLANSYYFASPPQSLRFTEYS
ncbi:hypothetical protein DSOL_4573 [Desulfosporosinus metallidurans]|uniref:Uncharacterized protein n=1 Tax=Desulfosporosinus metallidurans TaxID=1888891 RepID=A0A1Q8QJ82_9FIRM|nr:hypothetical protein DSOL_4573 [Desulfosporosinus metallidurans]